MIPLGSSLSSLHTGASPHVMPFARRQAAWLEAAWFAEPLCHQSAGGATISFNARLSPRSALITGEHVNPGQRGPPCRPQDAAPRHGSPGSTLRSKCHRPTLWCDSAHILPSETWRQPPAHNPSPILNILII